MPRAQKQTRAKQRTLVLACLPAWRGMERACVCRGPPLSPTPSVDKHMKRPTTTFALLALAASGVSTASVSGESRVVLPAPAATVDLSPTADNSYSMPSYSMADKWEDVGEFMQSFVDRFELISGPDSPRSGPIESSCSTCTATTGADLSARVLNYPTLRASASSAVITVMSGSGLDTPTTTCISGGIDLASQLLSSMQRDDAMPLGEQSIRGDDAEQTEVDGVDVCWEHPQLLLGASRLFLPMLCIAAMLKLRGTRRRGSKRPRVSRPPRLFLLLLFLLSLTMNGTRADCSSDPTCPLHSSAGTATCWAKGFGNQMWRFGEGSDESAERVFFPGVGLYSVSKISADVANCCFDIDVQVFACHATRGGVLVRRTPCMRPACALHAPCMRPACALHARDVPAAERRATHLPCTRTRSEGEPSSTRRWTRQSSSRSSSEWRHRGPPWTSTSRTTTRSRCARARPRRPTHRPGTRALPRGP